MLYIYSNILKQGGQCLPVICNLSGQELRSTKSKLTLYNCILLGNIWWINCCDENFMRACFCNFLLLHVTASMYTALSSRLFRLSWLCVAIFFSDCPQLMYPTWLPCFDLSFHWWSRQFTLVSRFWFLFSLPYMLSSDLREAHFVLQPCRSYIHSWISCKLVQLNNLFQSRIEAQPQRLHNIYCTGHSSERLLGGASEKQTGYLGEL